MLDILFYLNKILKIYLFLFINLFYLLKLFLFEFNIGLKYLSSYSKIIIS
jgi:hypothetical protein